MVNRWKPLVPDHFVIKTSWDGTTEEVCNYDDVKTVVKQSSDVINQMYEALDKRDEELRIWKEKQRSSYCVYCGHVNLRYTGEATEEVVIQILEASRKHDAECAKNPLVLKIKKLQEQHSWKSIQSIPRDGSRFLAIIPSISYKKGYQVRILHFVDQEVFYIDNTVYAGYKGFYDDNGDSYVDPANPDSDRTSEWPAPTQWKLLCEK